MLVIISVFLLSATAESSFAPPVAESWRPSSSSSLQSQTAPSIPDANAKHAQPSFYPIELSTTCDDKDGDRNTCIRCTIGEKSMPLLENLEPNAWSANPSQNGSGGIFLLCDPKDSKYLDTSNADIVLGDWSFNDSGCRIRWLACARQTRYWMGPAFGKATSKPKDSDCLPFDTQFLLAERKQDDSEQRTSYVLVLPLVDGRFRSSLQCGRDTRSRHLSNTRQPFRFIRNKLLRRKGNRPLKRNSIVCHIDSFDEEVYLSSCSKPIRSVYMIVGSNPYDLLKQGFRDVSDELKSFETLERKQVPSMVDGFGWCTWDAFYSDVTPEGVIAGVTSLQNAGIRPQTVIIDDGWQTVTPTKETTVASDIGSSGSPRLLDHLQAVVSKGLTAYYNKYVKSNRFNSIPNRIWRKLTSTILLGEASNYFEKETDFARQLDSFAPNEKFRHFGTHNEKGLQGLVSKLKGFGVEQVLCWHALHGYWRGISPALASSLSKSKSDDHVPQHSEHLLRCEPVVSWDSVSLFGVGILVDPDSVDAFYDGIHSNLVRQGIDGVKIDVQSGLAAVGGGVGGGPHLAKLYVGAMEKSVQSRFARRGGGINCINCMSHSTENLYCYKQTSIIRASDDFYPTREYSHTVHIINVAYNSLFLREIGVPDWDMFHSKHPSAYLHAAARAISGGPVYISDKPLQHDASLLKRLVLSDGSTLRPSQGGVPTRDSLFSDVSQDGKSALKIWNWNKSSIGIVGAFNVQGVHWCFDKHGNDVNDVSPNPVNVIVRAEDIEPFRGREGQFISYRHRSQKLGRLDSSSSEITIPLKHREWELVSISPLYEMNGISFAPIGLVDMFNSGGAIASITMSSSSTSSKVELSCRGSGRFLVYSSCRPSISALVDEKFGKSEDLPFEYDPKSGELYLNLPLIEDVTQKLTLQWIV